MFVICENDFPWAICPEETTLAEAQAIVEAQQVVRNKFYGHTNLYVHGHYVKVLTPEEITEILKAS